MKPILLWLCLFCLSFCNYGQITNLRNPSTNTNGAYQNLISDYGPRFELSGTKFHFGLDYQVLSNGVPLNNCPGYCISEGTDNVNWTSTNTK